MKTLLNSTLFSFFMGLVFGCFSCTSQFDNGSTNSDTDIDSDDDNDSNTDLFADTDPGYTDQDNDGWIEELDCDDKNPDANPGEEEIYDPPNRVDEDCDGLTDEDAAEETENVSSLSLEQIWYLTSGVTNDILIDFAKEPPVVTCNTGVGSSDGFEGTGVFTEPATGLLYFYTDGRSVFNGQTHAMLENGSGLFGDASATEPTLIAPMVGTDHEQFYIFTNNTNVSSPSSVYYSEIDLTLGANGTVTVKNVQLLTGNPGEALDLLPHPNGTDFWVLTFDGAEQLKAFLVTASGVSTNPVISPTGLTGQVKRGCINHTYDYDTLVLGQNYGGMNGTISVATVNRVTGEVGKARVIATGDLGYHASFSEDGTKVYYSIGTEGWRGIAHQYDLENGVQTTLGGNGLGGSKLAPNGKLYFAGAGRGYLGVVNNPNEPGVHADFVVEGLYLEGCSAGFSVPNQTAAYLDYLPPVI